MKKKRGVETTQNGMGESGTEKETDGAARGH